ncbi:alanine racemase [Barrientosiimonas marina]|uniref:Alanine racemase n=1 Tax=Lentibacillus kimchii TaxID=1542911 RepID=A0ABW2UYT4_9BACI
MAEVDLTAFQDNVQTLKNMAHSRLFMAVIKTNAYGHGVAEIGRAAVEAGADRLGVSTVEEGTRLREEGIRVPIHLLSSIMPNQASEAVLHDLIVPVSSENMADTLSREAVRQAKNVTVHLKIDTGLHRFGINPGQAAVFCRACYDLPRLNWEGVYTHFSNADEGDWLTTKQQFSRFMKTISYFSQKGCHFPIRHAGASTIAIERQDMHLDMVRPGIALFGYPPERRQRQMVSLRPVLTLRSRVLHVRDLSPDTPVGYGDAYVTSDYETIAVVPIGLGDGYPRGLAREGEMLIHGQRASPTGAISLDQTMINVTHISNVKPGDEVVIIGRQGNDVISARETANWINGNVDDVLASLTERVPRIYK